MKINNLQILGHNYNLNNFNPEDVEFIKFQYLKKK